MKNRELKLGNIPTLDELYALERKAHAMRSQEVARLLRRAFRFVVKGVKHA